MKKQAFTPQFNASSWVQTKAKYTYPILLLAFSWAKPQFPGSCRTLDCGCGQWIICHWVVAVEAERYSIIIDSLKLKQVKNIFQWSFFCIHKLQAHNRLTSCQRSWTGVKGSPATPKFHRAPKVLASLLMVPNLFIQEDRCAVDSSKTQDPRMACFNLYLRYRFCFIYTCPATSHLLTSNFIIFCVFANMIGN
jgi:hypothetical protein